MIVLLSWPVAKWRVYLSWQAWRVSGSQYHLVSKAVLQIIAYNAQISNISGLDFGIYITTWNMRDKDIANYLLYKIYSIKKIWKNQPKKAYMRKTTKLYNTILISGETPHFWMSKHSKLALLQIRRYKFLKYKT